jgi:predicted metal-dependent hydrolase
MCEDDMASGQSALRRRAGDAPPTRRTTIAPRDKRFDPGPPLPPHWHSGDAGITHFFDALSLMLPAGERFFMTSIRPFLRDIKDPELREQVLGFLGQEGMHSREHDRYNEGLCEQGHWTAQWIDLLARVALDATRRFSGQRWQLAITCAFEHLTATLADTVLRDPRVLRDAHPEYAQLWRWHGAEEIEHKGVAFDVYRAVAPGPVGYLRRVLVMWIITLNFFPAILLLQGTLMTHDDPFWAFRLHPRALRYLWWNPGLMPQGILAYLNYYRPDFHPWQHDNADLVQKWPEDQGSTKRKT